MKQPAHRRTARPRRLAKPAADRTVVEYAEADDPATADRIVDLFRRLLARATKR